MDFTLKTYKKLLNSLQKQNFSFQTFHDFITQPKGKVIVLRHDVDKLPENSLHFAQIQNTLGIKGSYFFRIVPESFNPEIIEKIAKLGHEIGYHYEDIDLASKMLHKQGINSKIQGVEKLLAEHAIQLFDKHLKMLRKSYPIKTICMHGSPLSKYDNKLIWKYYDYKNFGIIGEPYFDIDFSKVLYLTDTGRRWDGKKVSVRDKKPGTNSLITNHNIPVQHFHYTSDIITAANSRLLPSQLMFTFHPQRWTNNPSRWLKELIWQNTKNIVKYFLNKIR